jgi:hypothetical protein
MSSEFKEGYCKKWSPALVTDFTATELDENIQDIELEMKEEFTSKQKQLINYGRIIRYNVDGYVDNFVQYISAAISIFLVKQLMDYEHYWRDIMKHVVALRQISEPFDAVFWIDGLTKVQFEEGFGAATPMISNSINVYRYYNMSKKAFDVFKKYVVKDIRYNLTEVAEESIEEFAKKYGKSCSIVTNIMLPDIEQTVQGTSIVLEFKKDVYSFYISTPCKAGRWELFEKQLQCIYEKILNYNGDFDNYFDLVIRFGYYLYNFMPLSRGTACTTLIMMLGFFAKFGRRFTGKWPKDFQIDWEAILTDDVEEFVKSVEWLKDELIESEDKFGEDLTTLTLRDILQLFK